MTKTGEQEPKYRSSTRASAPVRQLGALLAASALFGGCSLSMPEDTELFTREGAETADASMDGSMSGRDASDDGSSDSGAVDDGGNTLDAGSDAAQGDADGATDAGQDAGPTVFDPNAGLVLHYRFNETTGNTVHDFAGSKDAIIVGTPSGHEQWVSAGRVDGALKLAGGAAPDAGTGHYVELPQGAMLGLNEATIALWVNRAGGPMWQRVFDLGSGPPVWIYFTASGGNGLPIVAGRTPALIFVDYANIPEAPVGEGVLKVNTPIPVSTWVHFALTWSAQQMSVYLDGKLAGSAVPRAGVTPTDLGNTGQNYIGRSQFAADAYFNGLVDEFRIYDRALSASDVMQLREVK